MLKRLGRGIEKAVEKKVSNADHRIGSASHRHAAEEDFQEVKVTHEKIKNLVSDEFLKDKPDLEKIKREVEQCYVDIEQKRRACSGEPHNPPLPETVRILSESIRTSKKNFNAKCTDLVFAVVRSHFEQAKTVQITLQNLNPILLAQNPEIQRVKDELEKDALTIRNQCSLCCQIAPIPESLEDALQFAGHIDQLRATSSSKSEQLSRLLLEAHSRDEENRCSVPARFVLRN